MIKKFSALLIALVLCLCLFACSGTDAPDGMKSVTIEGEPFVLYVPEAWTDNCSSGVSSAYYSSRDNILVTARYFTPAQETSLDAYVASLKDAYSKTLTEYSFVSEDATVLEASGVNAIQLVYTAKENGREFKYRQIVTLHKGDFVLLTFHCPAELYDGKAEEFASIEKVFKLCDREAVANDEIVDKKTPEGMKIASSDNKQYKFYVPKSWVCNVESGITEAYYDESGKPNVTVTAFSPDGEITAEQYFELCEAEYKKTLGENGYERLGDPVARKVADRDALSYTYSTKLGDKEFKIRQTVLIYNEIAYSITYTALTDSFDAHIADVDLMLDHFEFR